MIPLHVPDDGVRGTTLISSLISACLSAHANVKNEI